jgi:hypothetical protein
MQTNLQSERVIGWRRVIAILATMQAAAVRQGRLFLFLVAVSSSDVEHVVV